MGVGIPYACQSPFARYDFIFLSLCSDDKMRYGEFLQHNHPIYFIKFIKITIGFIFYFVTLQMRFQSRKHMTEQKSGCLSDAGLVLNDAEKGQVV